MSRDVNVVWLQTLWALTEEGLAAAPRGLGSTELLGYQTRVDMNRPILTVPERKLGYKFMAAEAAWILSGDNRVSSIEPFSRDIKKFSDNGWNFFGAYGPRLVDQIAYVIETLVKDPSSRQAVMTIWRENPRPSKDIPCTVALQWVIRHGLLYCINTMRSSDIWLGWPYDVFNFSMVSHYIRRHLASAGLNVGMGDLILTAGSQHLYDTNADDAKALVNQYTDKIYTLAPGPLVTPSLDIISEDLIPTFLWGLAGTSGALEYFNAVQA